MIGTGALVRRPPGQLQERSVPRILKRKSALAAAALAAAAFAGGAYAATQTSEPNARQAFLNDVAKRLGVTPQQLKSAFSGAAIDQLNAAVKAGELTQAQANAIKQRIQQGLPPLGPWFAPGRMLMPPFPGPLTPAHGHALPPFPGPLTPAHGHALPPRPFLHQGFQFPVAPSGPLEGAARYLGMSGPQLFKQLLAGKSLAQIAKSRGKSEAGLKSAMIAQIKSRLDKAVAAKMITSAQEQRLLKDFSSRLDLKISRSGYGPRFGFGEGHPRFFPGAARPFKGAARLYPSAPLPNPPAAMPGVPY
jgi:hypothetical protein